MADSAQIGPTPIPVALQVAALRARLGMTQEEFAHALGVTVSTVNRWERGHVEPSRLARKAIEHLERKHGTAR